MLDDQCLPFSREEDHMLRSHIKGDNEIFRLCSEDCFYR